MLTKSIWAKWLVLAFSMALLASCSGGGGGGGSTGTDGSLTDDTMILGISSGTTTTTSYTLTASSTGQWGYDPDVYGFIGMGATWVHLYSGYDSSLGWDTHLFMAIPITSAGTYTVVSMTDVTYNKRGVTGGYSSDGTSGTITFDRIDSTVGGLIQGSFSNVSLKNSSTNATIFVSGSFNVTRLY